MSSPIHKFLFSPPPSPPRRSLKQGTTIGHALDHSTSSETGAFSSLTSLRTLFLPDTNEVESDEERLPVVDEQDESESARTPTPSKYRFELAPSVTIASGSVATGHTRQRSSASTGSQRRPSLLVNVEDVDATPKAAARRPSVTVSAVPVQLPGAFGSFAPPLLAPAPRLANWREAKSHTMGRAHTRKRSIAPLNVPSSPLPPLSDSRESVFALIGALAHSCTRSARQPVIASRIWLNRLSSTATGQRVVLLSRPMIRIFLVVCLILGSLALLGQSTPEGVVTVPLSMPFGAAGAAVGKGAGRIRGVLAMDANGKAYVKDMESEAKARNYEPAQVRSAAMMQRAENTLSTRTQPSLPLPSTHELFALQSYLLQSSHNTIPDHVDPLVPLDAHLLLPFAASRKGRGVKRVIPAAHAAPAPGSGDAWLKELEKEREEDIVVWSLAPGSDQGGPSPAQIQEDQQVRLSLASVHGPKRVVSQVQLAGRSDRLAIISVLERLGAIPRDTATSIATFVMLGNQALTGAELLALPVEELQRRMQKIGWTETPAEVARRGRKVRKIQQAKWEKKEETKAKGKGKKGGEQDLDRKEVEKEVQKALRDAAKA